MLAQILHMKTIDEINAEILLQEKLLKDLRDRYSRLYQIDMMSGDGSTIRAAMNKAQGFIDALHWILIDQ